MTLAEILADLPHACDIGVKRDAKGYQTSWRGILGLSAAAAVTFTLATFLPTLAVYLAAAEAVAKETGYQRGVVAQVQ